MNEIVTVFSSPVYWVSVVVVGFIINFASTYLFKNWEKWKANKSKKKSQRIEREKDFKAKYVEVLMASKEFREKTRYEVLLLGTIERRFFLLGLILFIAPVQIIELIPGIRHSIYLICRGLAYASGSLFIVVGFNIINKAGDKQRLLDEAEEARRKTIPPFPKDDGK